MKKRLILALFSLGVGLALLATNLGANTLRPPTAEAAAYSLTVVDQQCTATSQVRVSFNWGAYNEGPQWFDLSLSNNGFVPGSFVGIGPLGYNQTSFTWDGILPGLTHYLRVNTLTPYGWSVSPTFSFTTRGDCSYGGSTISVVPQPYQQMVMMPVNGFCTAGAGWFMQNGYCYTTSQLNVSAGCAGGGYVLNGSCYYPSAAGMINGQCAAGSLMQNGQCYMQQMAPVQSPTCYAGYNQMGQCYDNTLTTSNIGQCRYDAYPDGNCY